MAKAALRQLGLGLAAFGLLMGCVEGAGSGQATSASGAVSPGSSRSASEVEAPDLFQVSDSALWDGRPSLGGIWVASPDVVDPQRVVMFNPANGKSVNGALFKRERDNPGPPLQVSSDAAEALGMLAGQPTALRVTALQKKEAAPPPAAEPVTEPAPVVADAKATDAAATATTDAGTEAAETAALAAAALAATGAVAETAGDPAAAAVAGAAEGAAEGAVAEAPKRKTGKERRAEAKARREADKAAKAAAAAAEAGAAVPDGTDAAAVAPTVDSAGVAAVETAPLDARSPEVAATPEPAVAPDAAAATEPPAEPVKKTRRQIREENEAAAAAAEAAAEAPAAEASAARPLQSASFSTEENANRAVEALAKINVSAQAQKSEQGGKTVWGVVTSGDEALLASIKDAGFADAFFLK